MAMFRLGISDDRLVIQSDGFCLANSDFMKISIIFIQEHSCLISWIINMITTCHKTSRANWGFDIIFTCDWEFRIETAGE